MVATRKSTIAALASLLASTVAAQTYTTCNPLKETCDPDLALGNSVAIDFTKGASDLFDVTFKPDCVSYNDDGISFTVAKQGDNPTIQSKFHIMFGRTEAWVKAAPGVGIVSSFVLQSDTLDEIDIEWIGGDTTEFQTNWFSKGDTTTYDRGTFIGVHEPQTVWHNYTIDWTPDSLTWYLDGAVVRQLLPNNGQGYPQSPMNIRIGSWAGGDPSNPPGTIQWAGGLTDYTKGPFDFSIKNLLVMDYSTGTEYKYTDNSGNMDSIEAIGGEVLGAYKDGSYLNIKKAAVVSVGASSAASSSAATASSAATSSSAAASSSSAAASSSSVAASSSAAASSSSAASSTTSSVVSSITLTSSKVSSISLTKASSSISSATSTTQSSAKKSNSVPTSSTAPSTTFTPTALADEATFVSAGSASSKNMNKKVTGTLSSMSTLASKSANATHSDTNANATTLFSQVGENVAINNNVNKFAFFGAGVMALAMVVF
ncbi:hypothetical protein NADFUDRAFT_46113 [Nadsonia fulvescens var. elongata DSM 6958]|uniref:Crh-like protein n=1 Tax=Nadsonia fulvescens var. elongata DSM 6958 TaxID=857566 RepID=A0A1E3PMS5_9ASCO|nr:hypothetical protein NADFUDRAFT_46113 [Nadsonia fulvescens var. elongata DSM 6958]